MQIYGSGSLGTHGYPERPVSRRNALAFSGRLGMCGAEALAETEGFEPSVPDLPVRRFSKPLVSATHPRLRMVCRANDSLARPAEGRVGEAGVRSVRSRWARSKK